MELHPCKNFNQIQSYYFLLVSTSFLAITDDSVFGKRVLTYRENRGTPDYSLMNGFMVVIANYIFLERGKSHLSKNVQFSIGTFSPSIWLYSGIPLFSPNFPVHQYPFPKYGIRSRKRKIMHLVAFICFSVCPFVCAFSFGAKQDHYQSQEFVCVFMWVYVDKPTDVVNRLLKHLKFQNRNSIDNKLFHLAGCHLSVTVK